LLVVPVAEVRFADALLVVSVVEVWFADDLVDVDGEEVDSEVVVDIAVEEESADTDVLPGMEPDEAIPVTLAFVVVAAAMLVLVAPGPSFAR